MATLKQQITAAFLQVNHPPLPAPLLSQIANLSTSLKLSPTQLAEAWEAHSLTKDVELLDDVTFGGYRNALCKEAGVEGGVMSSNKNNVVMSNTGLGKRKPPPGADVTPSPMAKRPAGTSGAIGGATTATTPAAPSNANKDRNGLSAVDNLTTPSGSGKGTSPPSKAQQPGSAASASVITPPKTAAAAKYADRKNSGQLVTSYNPNSLPTSLEVLASKSFEEREEIVNHRGCTISYHPAASHPKETYRHMFTPLEKRSTALEERLTNMNDAICDKWSIKNEDEEMIEAMEGVVKEKGGSEKDGEEEGKKLATWVPVGLPKQNKVLCVGRICNEVCSCGL